MLVSVVVGWTSSRPVIPDEHLSLIVQDAVDEQDASLMAAQWVASRPRCQMPTSTSVVAVVL